MLIRMLRRALSGERAPSELVPAGQSPDALTGAIRTLAQSGGAHGPIDYAAMAWILASVDAARYMSSAMTTARDLIDRVALLDFSMQEARLQGHVVEFGVFKGASLQQLASLTPETVHGFDSFQGLPEDWTYFQKKGRFSLNGAVVSLPERNVAIHPGWFDQTLPGWMAANDGVMRLIHVDCDIYSSAAYVLETLQPRIVSGTVIVFDEYLNYPGWEQHEFRAFREFIQKHGIRYRYIGFASKANAVAVCIE